MIEPSSGIQVRTRLLGRTQKTATLELAQYVSVHPFNRMHSSYLNYNSISASYGDLASGKHLLRTADSCTVPGMIPTSAVNSGGGFLLYLRLACSTTALLYFGTHAYTPHTFFLLMLAHERVRRVIHLVIRPLPVCVLPGAQNPSDLRYSRRFQGLHLLVMSNSLFYEKSLAHLLTSIVLASTFSRLGLFPCVHEHPLDKIPHETPFSDLHSQSQSSRI